MKAPKVCINAAGPPVEEPITTIGTRGSGTTGVGFPVAPAFRRLRYEIHSTEIERLEDVFLPGPTADDHNGCRPFRHDKPQEREPVHARHFEVEADQIRFEFEGLTKRFLTVSGDTDDLDQRRGLEHPSNRLTSEGGIVDHQNLERISSLHHSGSDLSASAIPTLASACQASSFSSPGTGRRYTRS